jgi:ABC-type Fe3+/spermidine/putrescine transport system ATPase subunit
MYGLEARGVAPAAARAQAQRLLERVGLAEFSDRSPATLSGGQRQRVAMARALVINPPLLLLDEPLGALDKKLREHMQIEIKRLHRETGATIMYVTHDQEEALALSDRIAVMNGGRIEQLGTPEELYDRPRTRFVADFIGTTNLLAGTVTSLTDGVAEIALQGSGRCFVPAGGLRAGAAVELSVRPEVLALARRQPGVEPAAGPAGDAGSWLAGTIEQSAYHGTSIGYEIRTDGGRRVTASVPRAQERLPAGTPVELRWRPEDTLVLGGPAMAEQDEEESP